MATGMQTSSWPHEAAQVTHQCTSLLSAATWPTDVTLVGNTDHERLYGLRWQHVPLTTSQPHARYEQWATGFWLT